MANVLRENLLIGIGHPLLDITAMVDIQFLTKYNLKKNDAVIATEQHQNVYKELVKEYPVTYTVGGSIQNTLRIIQWLIETPKVTTFFGAVGRDDLSNILSDKATRDGVNVNYQYVDKELTGTCIVLITGKSRSLCTNPASSRLFKIEHLQIPANKSLLDTADYYYMGGFFLSVSVDTVLEIAKIVVANKRQFLFNISAPFICKNYKDALLEFMPYFDVVFGNKSEIEAFAEALQIKSSNIDKIIVDLAKWPKIIGTKPRIIVLTQGENPVIVGIEDTILKFPIAKIEDEAIVDTNGAGDAFVGGFLAQYIQGKDLEVCVNCGIWTASKIIQKIGCTFEGKALYK
ncbi:unnamed protein product [Psylliodes chrysocephalus]|uniref:Adenosine kinase n=1 Tax=Psylliodes chrysocephalus TaxID=3402493 RepID=A0A9P0GKV4_9CUCU|nr:unnamed protein product [Psylliodes chrysocephala]